MLKKGDKVLFLGVVYTASSDEYELLGKRVIDLEGYSGEVAVDFLSSFSHEHRKQLEELCEKHGDLFFKEHLFWDMFDMMTEEQQAYVITEARRAVKNYATT